MALPPLKKLGAKRAIDVCKGLELEPDVVKLRGANDDARTFLGKLIDARKLEPAIQVLAAALPKRECVLWATTCARDSSGKAAGADELAALDAASKWAHDNTDANRRAAGEASEKATLDVPGGCAALAAFLAEGSLSPPELVPVPPAEHLSGLTAGSTVLLAAALGEPAGAPKRLERYLQLGLAAADAPAPWDAKR